MHIVTHTDLRLNIGVKIAVNRKRKDEELLDAIMTTLSRCVIVKPDFVGFNASQKHGQFGVTEPHPFPELAEPDAEEPHPSLAF